MTENIKVLKPSEMIKRIQDLENELKAEKLKTKLPTTEANGIIEKQLDD